MLLNNLTHSKQNIFLPLLSYNLYLYIHLILKQLVAHISESIKTKYIPGFFYIKMQFNEFYMYTKDHQIPKYRPTTVKNMFVKDFIKQNLRIMPKLNQKFVVLFMFHKIRIITIDISSLYKVKKQIHLILSIYFLLGKYKYPIYLHWIIFWRNSEVRICLQIAHNHIPDLKSVFMVEGRKLPFFIT